MKSVSAAAKEHGHLIEDSMCQRNGEKAKYRQ
jgi:hypothetical protein